MKSNVFFIIGSVFIGFRLSRWLLIVLGIVDGMTIPSFLSRSTGEIGLCLISISIYLRINEYIKSKS